MNLSTTSTTSSSISVSGLIGMLYDSGELTVINGANYGDIICDGDPSVVPPTFGLIYISEAWNMVPSLSLRNCINSGTIEALEVVGISRDVNTADNVVSMGVLKGSASAALFFDSLVVSDTLYSLEGICMNCVDITEQPHNTSR